MSEVFHELHEAELWMDALENVGLEAHLRVLADDQFLVTWGKGDAQ